MYPPRKCIFGCEPDLPIFALPKDDAVRQKWLEFIFENKTLPKKNSYICSRHFTSDSFLNKSLFDRGLISRLSLTHEAIPTLRCKPASISVPASSPSVPASSPSVPAQTKLITTVDMSCQNDRREGVRSIATQLSMKTLGPKFRSTGTQTTDTRKDVCVGTTTIAMESLEPLLFFMPTQRPRKRRRLELEDDGEAPSDGSSSVNHREERSVATSRPPESVTANTESPGNTSKPPSSVHKTHAYVVYENCLLELFQKCPVCMMASDVRTRKLGTFISVVQTCPHCQFTRRWNSQPVVGSTPAGNLQLSSAVYATGSSFFKLERILKAVNLKMPDHDTFMKHARMYIEPAIVHTWKKTQNQMLEQLSQQQNAVVRGGWRTDPTSRSAQFGCYTMMDLKSNKVVDLQLVQSNEVCGSNFMEKEGLKRSLSVLETRGVSLDSIVTDLHPEVQKCLSEANITQYYDVGKIEKGISKKLSKISESRDCGQLKKWLSSIKNHIYWTAASSTSGPERVAKWTSILNHIQDVHTHDNPVFPHCMHPKRKATNTTKWMTADAPAFCKLKKVMTNEKVLKDVEKLSPHDQTSSQGVFHSDILRFAPKNADFPYLGMLCRLYLAALHFNENSGRLQAAAASGDLLYKIHFPKSKKGKCTAKPVQVEPTFNYVDELMDVIFEKIFCDPTPYVEELLKIPIPDDLSTQLGKPDKLDVISSYVSRLNQGHLPSASRNSLLTQNMMQEGRTTQVLPNTS